MVLKVNVVQNRLYADNEDYCGTDHNPGLHMTAVGGIYREMSSKVLISGYMHTHDICYDLWMVVRELC